MAQEVGSCLMSGRLNGWQRVGIVLSVVWLIGAAIYETYAMEDRYNAAFSAAYRPVYDRCRDTQDRELKALGRPNGIDCAEEAGRVASAVPQQSAWSAAIAVFVPIPIAWLIAFALVALMRWIRRGFSPS
jgi:hypothetical protein